MDNGRNSDPRFGRAVEALKELSAADPAQEEVNGEPKPRELVQSERLAEWITRLAPDASTPLRLAAYAQHVGRYQVPRSSYPEGRIGYLRWRSDLAKLHAKTAAEILANVGYDASTIERVRTIVLKANRSLDAEVQLMEDALCLSFLEHEFEAFSHAHTDEMLISILRKTWRKMSEAGHAAAAKLSFSARSQRLLEQALSAASPSDVPD